MTIRGLLILAGEGTDLADTKLYAIEAPGYWVLQKRAGIKWSERVTTHNGRDHDFVTVVEDGGHDNLLAINQVGQQISGYPGMICGNVLFISWNHGPQSDTESETRSISAKAELWIKTQFGIPSSTELPLYKGTAPVKKDTSVTRDQRPGLTVVPINRSY